MSVDAKARQYAAAHLRQPKDAPLALYAGEAVQKAGAEEVAVAIWSLGDDIDPQMLRLENDPRAPQEARDISAVANAAFKQHFTRLHIEAIDQFGRTENGDVARVRAALWPLTHDGLVEYREPMQRPVIFYVPGLPAAPVEPNARFPWAERLEAAWTVIRDEYEAAVRRDTAMTPYVPATTQDERWRDLRGNQDWSAIHLFKDAARTPFADLFPKTIEALSAVDLVSINGVPVEAFFSRLRPGAHIPPHHGLTNSRVTVHLPIDAPPDCLIRVGRGEHSWRDGELIAFDDSYEHEAWNRSDRDRVVLIFEAPHPDLTSIERLAVEHSYSVRQNWLNNRRRLIRDFAAKG
jgi:aspartyl/asparaginyl beta-hydroxylase (cupin superfamily)